MKSLLSSGFLSFVLAASLYAGSAVPAGKSVEIKPLAYKYTVVQNFEHSVLESSHSIDGQIKENESLSHNAKVSSTGYFINHGSASANVSAKRDNQYKNYKESSVAAASTYNDTVMVEKTLYSEKMTGIIETALQESGIKTAQKNGDYVLTGQINKMEAGKPRLVPDGSGRRYAVASKTSIHIQISDAKTHKTVFAKSFTGTGQETFDVADPVPVDATIEASVEDLTQQLVSALSGKPAQSKEVDYQDSPGKRLID